MVAPTRAIVTGSAIAAAFIAGLHLLGPIPRIGPTFVFLAIVSWLGVTIHRLVLRATREGSSPSPLRGLVLALAAITVAALVLAILSGFHPGDWIVVAVPAATLVVLGTADGCCRGPHVPQPEQV